MSLQYTHGPASVCRPSSVRLSVDNFKHLLLQNRLANQSQTLCGASLCRVGGGDENLFAASESHDQDFSETIAACDLKAGRYRQLIE